MEPSSKGPAELGSAWSTARERSRGVTQVASLAVSALPVVLLGAMGYARRWVTEDAFINLRVVDHILAGQGPVFNAGERVEAFTSPLWVALLSVWGALHGSLEIGAVALGLILSAGGLVLAQIGAWRLGARLGPAADDHPGWPGPALIALPLGAAVYVATPVSWDFATSGLEGGLTTAWLGGTFWLLARARSITARRARLAALAIGCGPLIRPDLALFSVGFGAALAIAVRNGAPAPRGAAWAKLAIIAAALPVGYEIFRMGYFAALVPNTAIAKEAGAAYWSQGWRYTLDFFGPYLLWLPLAGALAWAIGLGRAARRVAGADVALVLAPMLAAVAHWLYVTRVGGDFMHGRLLLPSLLGFLLPVATAVAPVRALAGWRGVVLAGIGVWAVVSAAGLRPAYVGEGGIGPSGIVDERGFYIYHVRTANPIYVGDYVRNPHITEFKNRLPGFRRVIVFESPDGLVAKAPIAPSVPDTVRVILGLRNIGILGYMAGREAHVTDLLGLADPLAARLILEGRSRPGHEKVLPDAWVVARFSEPGAARARVPGAEEAARALECGALRRLLHAVSDPLTPRRFLANIGAAWSLHRLRIPADPAAAARRFCTPPSPAVGRALPG